MQAYTPSSIVLICILLATLVTVVCAGFVLQRLRPGWGPGVAAWTMSIVGLIAVERIFSGEPAGVRMLALIGFGFVSMKAVVGTQSRISGANPLPFAHWFIFALLWFGMRSQVFATREGRHRGGAGALCQKGCLRIAAGALLIGAAHVGWVATESRLLTTVLLLPGIILVVHFGVFNIVAGLWRYAGFRCRSLFIAPLRSQNLVEFWSRRWNLAFVEMTVVAVYRPLRSRSSQSIAWLLAFLFSGALHEIAISVPVGAGFGLPTLYFLIQTLPLAWERNRAHRSQPVRGPAGTVWAILWLVAPLPLLFHRPFLEGVVWPLVE